MNDLFGGTLCGGLIPETEWARACRLANQAKKEERRVREEANGQNMDWRAPMHAKPGWSVVENEDGLDDVRTLISTWPDPEPIKVYLEKMRTTQGNRMTADFRAKVAVFWRARDRSGALRKGI